MKHPTPLRALLGMTLVAAVAPETAGPSAVVDRRTHAPEGLGAATGFKGETLVDGADQDVAVHPQGTGASLVEIEKAAGAADTNGKQS